MKILVTLDGSAFSERALEPVKRLAQAARAEVHLLRVCRLPPKRGLYVKPAGLDLRSPDDVRALAEEPSIGSYSSWPLKPIETYGQTIADLAREADAYLQEKAKAFDGLPVKTKAIVSDDVTEAIIAYAEDHGVHIIAMASHGRTGLGRLLLGSTAKRVVESRIAPVLLVQPGAKHEGFGALIFDEAGTEILESCYGPDADGRCPRVSLGSPVACAGRRIITLNAEGVVGGTFSVTPDEEFCPLIGLARMAGSRRGKATSRSL